MAKYNVSTMKIQVGLVKLFERDREKKINGEGFFLLAKTFVILHKETSMFHSNFFTRKFPVITHQSFKKSLSIS